MSNIEDYGEKNRKAIESYYRSNDLAAISEAIAYLQDVIAQRDFSSLSGQTQYLVIAYAGAKTLDRFVRAQDRSDLYGAIDLLQRAIQLGDAQQLNSAMELNRLATAIQYRFNDTQDLADLAKPIELWRQAVALVPNPIDKGIFLTNLSVGLRNHARHNDDPKAIDEAIECCREAAGLVGSNAVARVTVISNLAEGLTERYHELKNQADIDEAISLYLEAISITKQDPRASSPLLNNLGQCLFKRYIETRSATDLNDSIRYYEEALNSGVDNLDTYNKLIINLLFGFLERYRLAGNADDLQYALSCAERSLELESSNTEERASRFERMGYLFRLLYDHTGEPEYLDGFVKCYSEALQLLSPSSPSFTNCLCELGDGFRRRHLLTNRSADLDAAIACHQQAVKHAAPGSMDQARALNSLGTSLGDQYLKTSAIEDLNESIELFRQALAIVIEKDTTIAAPCASNLGNCLRIRYGRTGDISDLTTAIDVGRQALVLSNADSPGRAMFLSNLGNSLREYYAHTEDMVHLAEAIKLFQEAVLSPTQAVSDRPMFLTNLGLALLDSYEETKRATDLDRAIEHCKKAAALTPEDAAERPIRLTNLGVSLLSRYLVARTLDDLKESIKYFEQAFRATPENAPSRAQRLGNLASSLASLYSHTGNEDDFDQAATLWSQACEQGIGVDPGKVLGISQAWGQHELKRKNWEEAVKAFSYGIQAIEQLYRAQMLRPNKEAWLHEAQRLAINFAYALARCGNLAAAVSQLEGGRARLLADSIEYTRVEIEELPSIGYSELYERYKSAVTRIKELEQYLSRQEKQSARDITAEWLTNRAALDSAIADIRQVSGYEDFFALPDFEYIQETLTSSPANEVGSHVGIYFAVTSVGGLALIIHPSGIEAVWLDVVAADLLKLLVGDRKTDGYLRTLLEGSQLRVKLDQVLAVIAEKVCKPVAETLSRINAASGLDNSALYLVLIPTGDLSLFPLPAVFYLNEGNDLPHKLYVSYAPSARALRYCQTNLSTYKAQGLAPTMLGVGNPLPLPPDLPSLIYARVEVEQCARFFADRAERLIEDQATRSAVISKVASANYLHFSCHGYFLSRQPLSAGIVLSNGEELTVSDLLHMHRLNGSRLVVLSACQTALSDFLRVPEEAVGLPASFLQIGVPGVIGSLWPVSDLSTALLMIKFYEYHMLGDSSSGPGEPMTPSQALCRAQLWLRDLRSSELKDLLETLSEREGDLPEDPERTEDERPFSDPFYWAPFVLYGV